MRDKIIEILNKNIKDRFEKHLSFWPKIEMENFIEYTAEEIVNTLNGETVKREKVCKLNCSSKGKGEYGDEFCNGCEHYLQT